MGQPGPCHLGDTTRGCRLQARGSTLGGGPMGPGSRSRGGKRQVPHCKHLQEQVPSNQFLLKHKKSLKQDPPLPSTIMGCMNQKKQLKAMEMIPLPHSSKSCGLMPRERVGDAAERSSSTWELLCLAHPKGLCWELHGGGRFLPASPSNSHFLPRLQCFLG